MERWARSPELIDKARDVLNSELFGHIWSVMYNQIPSNYPLRGEPTDAVSCALELGRKDGYMLCLALLRSLGHIQLPAPEIEPDYGAGPPPTME